MAGPSTLVIGCGALARELKAVIAANGWTHIVLSLLPAELHNRPERIADAVRRRISEARGRYDQILCAYADCGTGGLLDRLLEAEGVERIGGAHCYAFYAGLDAFDTLAEEEPGTFYLTDYLVRHFERLVIKGLGIDRHPELEPLYFGNYRRMVWLVQAQDTQLTVLAEAAAARLKLPLIIHQTGLGGLASFLSKAAPVGALAHG
jgi:hypothetical protein